MRALQLLRHDGPDGLAVAEVAAPERTSDAQVLLDVRAIGINFPDLLATKGQYQHRPALPFVPGCEVAGVVAEAPPGSGWEVGHRAAAFVWDGGYAERVVVPLSHLVAIPDDVDHATAAAMVVNYHTVHFALARRGAMRRGETVLVLGAAGGIGTAAVQVARGLGGTVVGGVGSDAQAAVAAVAGAHRTVVLADGFSREVRSATGGRGVDIVVDPLGDWLFDEGVRALAPEGRILVVGFAAGRIPEIAVNRLLLRNVAAVGVAWGAVLDTAPDIMRETGAALNGMLAEGVVAPHVAERFAFAEIPAALRRLERGAIAGKAVVEMDRPEKSSSV